jgi:hypothetical protein
MFWARLGSLHALHNSAGARFWKNWLRRAMPSADSMGRVCAQVDTETLRRGLHHVYSRLKRNKALKGVGRLSVAVLDGHETSASYLRHCPGCLTRTIHTHSGDRVQYYHRNVTLMLLGEKLRFLMDVEQQCPGEDELAAAMRLLDRVLTKYPRAFELVLADALYAKAPFINYLSAHGKYALVVLKDESRDVYADAIALFRLQQPVPGCYRNRACLWWDVESLTSWPQVTTPMRVVRSSESYWIRRQASGETVQETAEWMWITNLPAALARTPLIVQLGHARWDIENYGFNELVNGWHADHVYRHDPTAIEAMYLLALIAFNLFHAFLALNVKPELRAGKTEIFWAQTISAELHRITRVHLPP